MISCAAELSHKYKISEEDALDVLAAFDDVENIKNISENEMTRHVFRLESASMARNYLINNRVPFFKSLITGERNTVYGRMMDLLNTVAKDQATLRQTRMGRILNKMPFPRQLFARRTREDAFVKAYIEDSLPFEGNQKGKVNDAFTLAEMVWTEKKAQVDNANQFGAGMLWRDDHVTQQWHDITRMVSAGPSAWVKFIHDRLDFKKSFNENGISLADLSPKARTEYLENVYKAITKSGSEFEWTNNVMEKSLAKRMQMSRHLQLKDATSWLEYNQKYGHQDPMGAVLESMNIMDDRIVLLRALGSNPRQAFHYLRRRMEGEKIFLNRQGIIEKWDEKVFSALEKKWLPYAKRDKKTGEIRGLDSVLVDALEPEAKLNVIYAKAKYNEFVDNADARTPQKVELTPLQKDQLNSMWKWVSGETFVVGRPSIVKFMQGMQASLITSTLGKAMISSFGDAATVAVNLHGHGRGFLGSYHDIIKAFQAKLNTVQNKLERVYILNQMNVGLEGVIQEAFSRYSAVADSGTGLLNKMQNTMFDVSFLNSWTNMWKEVWGRSASMHMAASVNKSWSNLPDGFRKALGEHRIREADWKELQKVGGFTLKQRLGDDPKYKKLDLTDDEFITPDWIAEQIGGEKGRRLEHKLNSFYMHEARIAVPTPETSDRAFMMRTFQRGTVPAVVAQMFFTFRSHPVVMMRKVLPRMWEMGLPSLLHLTPMIGLGYASLAVKDMIKGKEPRSPNDPQVMLQAFAQSGFAAGIGDFFIEEMGRHHSTLDESLIGPHYEFFKDVASLVKGLVTGQDGAADAWALLRERTPFMNLFYTELAYNYLIHYQMMESLQPGYVQMIENWSKGVDQQRYFDWLRPSNFVSYGGPFR